jgi:hypothetical protein
MKLCGWGGVVPFVGFRRIQMPAMEAVELGIDWAPLVTQDADYVWVETFELEWLGFGVMLFAKPG